MNVFDLQAKIGLDSSGFDQGLSSAEGAFSALGSKIKSGISTVAKVTATAMTAAAAGVAALSKQAIEGYADYEQLVGGVETLFGAGGMAIEDYAKSVGKSVDEAQEQYDKLMSAQSKVMENAADAYKTAGLSANEYMETVTSFSASLIASLGGDTEKAAAYADKAIVDMSDNANKMGTSMESIQNAYQGFAKQNYTMLDNLKLGYGGTGSEMQRLIQDAEKLDGTFKAARNENGELAMSYADIVDAIHIVQENMGINGTTAKEAAATISGSIGMMKSAWSNLVTGIANDEADFDKLIDNFVESVDAAAHNIIPRVEIALQGVGKLVEKLVPTLLERIPALIRGVLPELAHSAFEMITVLGESLALNADELLLYVVKLLSAIGDRIKEGSSASYILDSLVEALAKRIPQILGFLTNIALTIVRKISDALQDNKSIGVIMEGLAVVLYDIAETIAVGLPEVAEIAFSLIKGIGEGIIENLPCLLEETVVLVQELAEYIAEAAPEMLPQIVELVMQIAEMLTEPDTLMGLLDAALQIILALAEGLLYALPKLIAKIPVIIENLKNALIEAGPKLGEAAVQLIGMLAAGLIQAVPAIIKAVMQIYDSINETILSWGVGLFKAIKESWEQAWQALKPFLDLAKMWGKDLIDNFIGGIKSKWEDLKKSVSDVAQTVKDFLGFSEPKEGPLSNFHTYAPDMMDLYSKGIKDNASKLTASLETSLEGVASFFEPKNAQSGAGAATNIFNINISTDAIASDYDAYRAAQRISEELGNLQRMQALAVGA